MGSVWQGPGRGVLALFVIWALVGQHVFIHHLGGTGLDLPFNAVTWLFAGMIFIAGAFALRSEWVSSKLGRCFAWAALVLWLPWVGALLADGLQAGVNLQAAYWQALPRLLALTAGVLLFWLLQQCRFNAQQRHFVLCTLLMLATVQIGFGLVQFFLLPADNWFMFNTKVRFPYGIFMQRNVMSSFVGSGVLLALYLLVRRSGETGREQWHWWLWCSLVAIAGLVLVVLLQSRAGLYSLLMGLFLLLPVCWMRLSGRLQRGVLLALIVCGTATGVALLLHFDLHRRALAVYGELGVRYEIWHTTLGLIAQHVWLGVGYGNFEPAYYAEAGRLLATTGTVPDMGGNLAHPHNEILMWWAEGGVITLLAWMLLAWGALRLLWRLSASERLAMVALCLPLFAHLMSEYPLGHSSVHWIWLLVVVWYFNTQAVDGELHIKPKPTHLLFARITLLLIGGGTLLYMTTGLQTAYQLTHYERDNFSSESRLESATNPWFWADRQALYHNSIKLSAALNSDLLMSPEQARATISDYLAWSSSVIARLPRTTLLHNHLVALLAAGQNDAARALAARLQLEYPHQKLFKKEAMEQLKKQLLVSEPPRVFHHLTQPVGAATYY